MGVAKRTLYVKKNELKELFGLPEGVEILAVRPSRGFSDEESFEFLLVSAGEVEVNGLRLTEEVLDGTIHRRIGLETIRNANEKQVE